MAVKSLANSSILQPQSGRSMLAGYESNYFHHLETVRLGGTASSVTFSNLARYNDYQHLQIRAVFRTNRSGYTATYWGIRLNGDSGSNYSWHWLSGGYSGSAVESVGVANQSRMRTAWAPGNNASANLFAVSVTDFIDAFDTTKFKTIRTINGKTESEANVVLSSGNWRSTDAVTSIEIQDELGASFVAGSRFSLYGLKARA